jgi:hypothetical protein
MRVIAFAERCARLCGAILAVYVDELNLPLAVIAE